jgi:hypothetical protein
MWEKEGRKYIEPEYKIKAKEPPPVLSREKPPS